MSASGTVPVSKVRQKTLRAQAQRGSYCAPVIPSRRVSPDSLLMIAGYYQAKRTPQYAGSGATDRAGGLAQSNPKIGFCPRLDVQLPGPKTHSIQWPGVAPPWGSNFCLPVRHTSGGRRCDGGRPATGKVAVCKERMSQKEKVVTNVIKLLIKAGQAKPAPPVGPALGQAGLNIMNFCKDFNARTANLKVRCSSLQAAHNSQAVPASYCSS